MIWFTDPLNLAPQEEMQIQRTLHLLSLWPFMPHIESGNKSLIEFMKGKNSQTNLEAASVGQPLRRSADVFGWLPVSCSSNPVCVCLCLFVLILHVEYKIELQKDEIWFKIN